jgi:hypothetical protein
MILVPPTWREILYFRVLMFHGTPLPKYQSRNGTDASNRFLWKIKQFPIPICPIPIEIGRDTPVLVEHSNQVTMAPQA